MPTETTYFGATSQVWVASLWRLPIIIHDRARDDVDRLVTAKARAGDRYEERTALVPAWTYTACGVRFSELIWSDPWSTERGRFAIGDYRGHLVPLRSLNPALSRLCRRCFEET